MESVGGIIFNARVVQLEGTNHGVEAYIHAKQAFLGRIGKDESRRAACVGNNGDGLNDGEYGLAKADHIVVYQRANDGGVALLRLFPGRLPIDLCLLPPSPWDPCLRLSHCHLA